MRATTHPPRAGGRWRLHVDVRDGELVTGEVPLDDLATTLVQGDVPSALLDIGRSERGSGEMSALRRILADHPRRFWVGGFLHDASVIRAYLDLGARGAIIGSALFADGRLNTDLLEDILATVPADRLMVAVDVRDGEVVSHGFTSPTGLAAQEAFEGLARVTANRCAVLYVDVVASQRATGPGVDELRAVRRRHPRMPLWCAGGIRDWSDVESVWSAGAGAVVGRHWLTSPIGLASSS